MMGNDGLTLTETLLYPYPLTSIRSCLPACLPGCLADCLRMSVGLCLLTASPLSAGGGGDGRRFICPCRNVVGLIRA